MFPGHQHHSGELAVKRLREEWVPAVSPLRAFLWQAECPVPFPFLHIHPTPADRIEAEIRAAVPKTHSAQWRTLRVHFGRMLQPPEMSPLCPNTAKPWVLFHCGQRRQPINPTLQLTLLNSSHKVKQPKTVKFSPNGVLLALTVKVESKVFYNLK